MSNFKVEEFNGSHEKEIGQLIIGIQQEEFGVKITLEQQPDLKKIKPIYQSGNGNFWLALNDQQLIGTIGLMDIGKGIGALRKMFVHRDFRGKEIGVGKMLLEELVKWADEKNFREIYLGTTADFVAAHRFYEKNGFVEVQDEELPKEFPKMPVDTKFYRISL